MDFNLDTTHGLKEMILSLVGIIFVYLVKDIIKGVYSFINRNRGPSREEFINLTHALKANSELLGQQKLINEKMEIDVRRIYLFLKVIAGEKWREYRKQVEEIEKEN